VSAPGHAAEIRDLGTTEQTDRSIRFALEPLPDWPDVHGIVRDETGMPVSGADVLLLPRANTFDLGTAVVQRDRTGPSGRFSLRSASVDRHDVLLIIHPDFPGQRTRVDGILRGRDLDVTIPTIGVVHIRLISDGGSIHAWSGPVEVCIDGITDGSSESLTFHGGDRKVGLRHGRYLISVALPGLQALGQCEVLVSPSGIVPVDVWLL